MTRWHVIGAQRIIRTYRCGRSNRGDLKNRRVAGAERSVSRALGIAVLSRPSVWIEKTKGS